MSKKAGKKNQKSPPQDGPPLPIRLAVFELSGEGKSPLGRITLTKNEDGKWDVKLEAKTEENGNKLKPVIQRFVEKRAALADGSAVTPPATALASDLAACGFIVQKLPAGDYTIGIQIDFNKGRVLGTNTALHDLAEDDDSLGRRIVESIEKAFRGDFDGITKEIETHVSAGAHIKAVAAIQSFVDGGKPALSPTLPFLEAINSIDVTQLSPEDKRLMRNLRLEVSQRLAKLDVTAIEAEALLKEDTTLSPNERANLKMAVVLGPKGKGNPESQLLTLKSLLKEPSDLNAAGRGWAWRNISLTLSDDHPDTIQACKNSADAFLEAGDKEEAAKSLIGAAKIYMKEDPAAAVKSLAEIINFFDSEGLTNRYVKSAVLHAKGNRLAMVHRHEEAFEDALKAVELRRGLIGAEESFVSSLHLAAVEARFLGRNDEAEIFEKEARQITQEVGLAHFQLSERVAALFKNYDDAVAKELAHEAEMAGNIEVFAGIQLSIAANDPSLSDDERLQLMEETLKRLEGDKRGRGMVQPAQLSIATHLHRRGIHDRAAIWYRRILEDSPLDGPARQNLVHCLWKESQWNQAAEFLHKQTTLDPDKPGLWYALGKSLFEAKDMSGAVTALSRSLTIIDDNSELRTSRTDVDAVEKAARELLQKALKLGGTILPPSPPPVATGQVSREELETALHEFAVLMSSKKRMTFWRLGQADHEWVASPEKHAQNLLHVHLKGWFRDRIEVFEEISVGAGRLDVRVTMRGELSAIIELKMCGFGYSSNYASEGEDQITHYMDNLKTSLGYLLVFDARLTGNGQALLSGQAGRHTIQEIAVDVTPRVTKRKRSLK